jgi:hypothetical protein
MLVHHLASQEGTLLNATPTHQNKSGNSDHCVGRGIGKPDPEWCNIAPDPRPQPSPPSTMNRAFDCTINPALHFTGALQPTGYMVEEVLHESKTQKLPCQSESLRVLGTVIAEQIRYCADNSPGDNLLL